MNVANNATTIEIIRDIKSKKNSTLKNDFLSSYLISSRVSPYFSGYYISKKIKPNSITLHMIFSGIIGAILFSFPNIYIKILGAVIIHLWFVLDCSDGEVARYTKTFSKFGKEMDYLAHLINHPLFGGALFLSMIQLGRYNLSYLAITLILSNFLDYLYRNLTTLDDVIDFKETDKKNQKDNSNNGKWDIKSKIIFVASIFIIYPNVILFSVIIYFVDFIFGTSLLYIFLVLSNGLTLAHLLKKLVVMTRKFHRS